MNTQLDYISKVWPDIKSVFSVPHTEEEYENLVQLLDALIDEVGDDEQHDLAPIMETIGKLIENYEQQNLTIADSSPVETLKYLMQEHNLKQSDLKEIGSQGVVSEVLNGKRHLNIEQIKRISNRFRVSPAVFI